MFETSFFTLKTIKSRIKSIALFFSSVCKIKSKASDEHCKEESWKYILHKF